MSENVDVPVKGNPNLRVFILDDDTNIMHTCLGITEERSDELIKIVQNSFEDSDTHTNAFVEISKSSKHANEFAYMLFHYGAFVGQDRFKNELLNSNLLDTLKKGMNPESE